MPPSVLRLLVLSALLWCALAPPAWAEDAPRPASPTAATAPTSTATPVAPTSTAITKGRLAGLPLPPPPAFGADGKDWLRLSSGEWLRGRLDAWRDFSIEFWSEKLKDLTFDDDDVSEAVLPSEYGYVFLNPDYVWRFSDLFGAERFVTVHGPAVIGKDEVTIRTSDGEKRYPRAALAAVIADAEDNEWAKWRGRLSVGMNSSFGNSSTRSVTGLASLTRESTASRLRLGYSGALGVADDVETDNYHRGEGAFDVFLSERLYLTPAMGNATYDRPRNIELAWFAGAGIGYRIIKEKWGDLRALVGGGYGRTRFRNVDEGEPEVREDPIFSFSTEWDFDITSRLSFYGKYTLQLAVADLGNTTHHAEGTLEWKLTEDVFTFSISAIFDRVENPARREDGTEPEANDLRLLASIGVRF